MKFIDGRRLPLAFVLACVLACVLIASPARAQAQTPKVHALLIGVGAYPRDSGVSTLNGPVNDVRLIANVLKDRFAVPAANIVMLTDKAATHTAIEAAFGALATRMQPGDQVYIHYAGHGSRSPNPNERRGEDQTWVSFGARSPKHAGKNHLDVLDKELALWMQPLYAKSPDVVFVSDSCHSATVTRGPTARTTPPATRLAVGAHPLLATLPVVPPPETGLRIGAARDFEYSHEFDPRTRGECLDPKQCYGVFTWHWAKALRESRPGDKWMDLFQRTSALVGTVSAVAQVAQIDGRGDRELFQGKFAPAARALAIAKVGADGKTASLAAGRLSGISVGSGYRSTNPASGREATLTITSAGALASQARVDKGRVAVGDLVTEVSHAYSTRRIRIHVRGVGAGTQELARTVRAGLVQATASAKDTATTPAGALAGAFELVDSLEASDWEIRVAARADSVRTATDMSSDSRCASAPCQGGLMVLTPGGALVHDKLQLPLPSAVGPVPWLVSGLAKVAWSREVRGIAAEGNQLPISMAVIIHRHSDGARREGQDACPKPAEAGTGGWRRLGPFPLRDARAHAQRNDCMAFTIANSHTTKPYYAYVVAIGPDLAVQRLFPADNQVDDEARIRPQESVATRKNYVLNATGEETILLIVSEGTVQTLTLEQAGIRGSARHRTGSQLERLLSSRAIRGEVFEGALDEWGAESSDITIPASRPDKE